MVEKLPDVWETVHFITMALCLFFQVMRDAEKITDIAQALGRLDVSTSLAVVAKEKVGKLICVCTQLRFVFYQLICLCLFWSA